MQSGSLKASSRLPQKASKLGRVGAGFTRTESTKTVDGRKLLGNVELSRAITRAGVPRGVAVASIARLPSSTDDPPSSGSTADRHWPCEGCGRLALPILLICRSAPRGPVAESSGGAEIERARFGRRGWTCAAARVRLVHARPHVLGSLREESASCLAGSAVRMTRDLGLAERAQSAE